MALDDLRVSRLAFAAVSAVTVLTWYALPDAVRSRQARVVIKAGLLGVSAAGAGIMIPQVFPEALPDRPAPLRDLPPSAVALALGATATTVLGTLWFEKFIYAHGERRRASGIRCAHTPVAAALAVATGAGALVDWKKLAGRIAATRG